MSIIVLGASGTIGTAVANELERLGANPWRSSRRGLEWPDRPVGLVSCFGDYGPRGQFSHVSVDEWRSCFETNFFAQLEEVKRFTGMLDGRHGRVVLMSGGGIGTARHPWNRVAYTACKGALVHFVEAVATELPNIAINAVAPGPVLSKMTNGELDPRDAISPEYCAKLVGWLMTSERAATISGRLLSARYDQAVADKVLGEDDYRLRRFVP